MHSWEEIETLGSFKEEIQSKTSSNWQDIYFSQAKIKGQKKLCFKAVESDKLLAFVLVNYSESLELGEIDQIYSEPEVDQETISSLIHHMEMTLRDMGCMIVQFYYEFDVTSSPPLIETILLKNGFGLKTPCMILYFFDIFAFHPPWFDKEYPLPPGFSFLLWKDVDIKEKERLAILQERFSFHYFISPNAESSIIQPINSLGLLFEDKVVGWVITHTAPFEPDTIRYSAFYVEPEYLAKGVAVPLLQKSIQLQQQSPLQWGFFTINLEYTEKRWLKFVNQRIKSNAYKTIKVYRLSKSLMT